MVFPDGISDLIRQVCCNLGIESSRIGVKIAEYLLLYERVLILLLVFLITISPTFLKQ